MNCWTAVRKFALLISVYSLGGLSAVNAGEVEIVKVKAEKQRAGWVFHVTLKHGDTGWDHYADGWRVVTEDGKELGTRTLYHPHVDEQPFTRSLADVNIPADISAVYIEAHDKVHGWSKQKYRVKIR
ncbi:hypothetical protein [Kaarinaea lacus]